MLKSAKKVGMKTPLRVVIARITDVPCYGVEDLHGIVWFNDVTCQPLTIN